MDWQWPLSGVYSILMVVSAQPGEGGSARPPFFILSNPLTQVLSPPPPILRKLAREGCLYSTSCPSLLVSISNDRPCTQGAGKGERVGLVQSVQVRDQYSTSNVLSLCTKI
jgi:hypothetical protein